MRPAHERINSARLVEKLKRQSPWLAELCSKGEEDDGRVGRFMHEGADFRGARLHVSEMTGQPGDVISCTRTCCTPTPRPIAGTRRGWR